MQINAVLEILIGNRETIRRSAASGTVSGFFMAVLFVIYFAFFQFNIDIESLSFISGDLDFGAAYVISCLSIAFVIFGGRSIGWLFIRPAAGILHRKFPRFDTRKVWIISTVSVWVPITFLALYPYQQSNPLLQGVLLIGVLLWVIASGAVGGHLGAKASMDKSPKEWREYMVIGGTTTGSSLVGLQTLANLVLSPASITTNVSNSVIGLCLSLPLLSFVAMLPYFLIVPLSVGLSLFSPLDAKPHMAHVLVSGITFTIIGFLLSGGNGNVWIIPMGLCGACGGWAIAQFREDV